MSEVWAAALDDFETRVGVFEDCLARGDLEGFPPAWRPPGDLDEPPTRDQRARADALLARARACEGRVAELLHHVAEQLHTLRATTDAASSYQDASSAPSGAA